MYYCSDCGERFCESDLTQYNGETTEFWGSVETTTYLGCPNCGSDHIREVYEECSCCGADIFKGDRYYQSDDGEVYCTDCIKERRA